MAGARRRAGVAEAVARLSETTLLRREEPDGADEERQLPPAGPPPAHLAAAPSAAGPVSTAAAGGRLVTPAAPSAPAEPEANTNVALPVSVKDALKTLTRPHRTGQERVLGAHWLARAYVIAVHELIGDTLDLHGLGVEDGAQAVTRIHAALAAALGPAAPAAQPDGRTAVQSADWPESAPDGQPAVQPGDGRDTTAA